LRSTFSRVKIYQTTHIQLQWVQDQKERSTPSEMFTHPQLGKGGGEMAGECLVAGRLPVQLTRLFGIVASQQRFVDVVGPGTLDGKQALCIECEQIRSDKPPCTTTHPRAGKECHRT
jgi:hypothetical protein